MRLMKKLPQRLLDKQESVLAEKDGHIDRLLRQSEQLIHECEILRGEIHLLTHRINLEDDNDF